MDEDILMAMLSNITQEITEVKDEVSGLTSWIPGETSTFEIEIKLDRIIQLLEQLVNK